MNVAPVATSLDRFANDIGSRLDGVPLAVMLDVDGTLAPIAPAPEKAVVPPETRDVLRQLTALNQVHVALVSGRSVADTWRMTGIPRTWIVGNHGLEWRTPDGAATTAAEAKQYESRIAEAAASLDSITRATNGARVEDKRWTISLHYRLVTAAEIPALISGAREVGARFGLRVTEGKKVLELRPPLDLHKGTAAIAFVERVGANRTGSMLYAGDDQTDEDAFRALRSYSPLAVTIRISGPDDSSRPVTAAEFILPSTTELQRTLQWLIEHRSP